MTPKIRIYVKDVLAVILLFMIVTLAVGAAAQDEYHVLKISAQDERAIIKTPDGTMQLIKVGDMVGNGSNVVEITAGRVVFEEKTGNETETVIIRLEHGKQRVERIKKTSEQAPAMLAPAGKDMGARKRGSGVY